jgi:hypothetical protein
MSNLLRASVFAVCAGGLVLASARTASATPDFPAALATDLGVTCVADCTICHTNNSGGAGTVTQPFGRQLQIYGLAKYDQASLQNALNTCKAAGLGCDTNCNGTNDVDELTSCINPNLTNQCDGGTSNLGDVVIYGCETSPRAPGNGPAGPGSAAAAIAALLLGGLLVGRMRRRA